MTLLDRWCADWLRWRGWRLAEPGAPDPADPRVAAPMLRDAGWTLFAPGIKPPVPPPTTAEAELGLTALGFTVLPPGEVPHVSVERAIEVLRGAGFQVFPPRRPPALGPWVPTIKGDHPPRTVMATPDGEVHYVQDGALHRCGTGAFWKWRSKVNAVHREPGAP